MIKKVIKNLTCRRHVPKNGDVFQHGCGEKSWRQTFRRGYVEQCFRRTCVRSSLLHGPDNEPYLERHHHKLRGTGRSTAPATHKHSLKTLHDDNVEALVRAMMAADAELEAAE